MISASKPNVGPCEFNLTISGQNLPKKHIVFLIKRIIKSFLKEFEFLLEDDEKKLGRPKKYKTEELFGLIVLGALYGKNSCREIAIWLTDNDEPCTYIMNNKKPKKSTINGFYNGRELLIELLFDYTVEIGLKEGLIGGEHAAIDGTIFKAFASRFKLITIDELNYLENLINSFDDCEYNQFIEEELRKYYKDDILDEFNIGIVEEAENNLKKEAINLLAKFLLNSAEKENVLKFIDYLKENYNGKHTISVTDPECRWMKDKKRY